MNTPNYLEIARRVMAERAAKENGRLQRDKQAEVDQAADLLNREGARIFKRDGAYQIGVWKETPDILLALKALDLDRLPVVNMDHDEV